MKKSVGLFLIGLWMTACAGNPPAWWNPDNRYGTLDHPAVKSSQKTGTVRRQPAVTEQTMDALPDDSYEEITLTPMPDEDEETQTGVAEPEEPVPADGSLPVPSVLD